MAAKKNAQKVRHPRPVTRALQIVDAMLKDSGWWMMTGASRDELRGLLDTGMDASRGKPDAARKHAKKRPTKKARR